MIHHPLSGTPLIKKINLNIWSLQEEILSFLKKRGTDNLDNIQQIVEENFAHRGMEEDGQIIQSIPHLDKDKITRGMAILSEISMENIFLFVSDPFTLGQNLAIQFDIPKKFVCYTEVISCFRFNNKQKIISQKSMNYRITARFLFTHFGERSLLREFVSAIYQNQQRESIFLKNAPITQALEIGENKREESNLEEESDNILKMAK